MSKFKIVVTDGAINQVGGLDQAYDLFNRSLTSCTRSWCDVSSTLIKAISASQKVMILNQASSASLKWM